MKAIILALFVVAATASPIPDDDSGPVDVIVNGVPEGAALDIAHIVDVKVKEHVDGEVVSATNALYPFTAEGIAAAAAAEEAKEEEVIEEVVIQPPVAIQPVIPEIEAPGAIVLPEPAVPEVNPEVPGIVLPEPAVPEVVPETPQIPGIVLPEPALPEVPEIVVPEPALPIVIPEPEIIPEPAQPEVVEPVEEPAQTPNGEIFNNGLVSVTLNTPQEPTILSTLSSWFSMVLNYFDDDTAAPTSHQIV